jgi:hypothetical protein
MPRLPCRRYSAKKKSGGGITPLAARRDPLAG